tara:strand:- start:559 stop:1302 length:744 start_codon:yes stop_codon:yes gene_type:complete
MIEEVLNNFNNVKIDNNPFSHKVINNIFPQNFYKDLIKNLPNKNQYTPINKTGRVSSNYPAERFIFGISKKSVKELNTNQQDVFNKIILLFTNPKFFNVISTAFKDTINNRINDFNDNEKKLFGTSNFQFKISSSLIKDITKYKLGVHTDTPSKFLTFLFYIPEDESLKDLGTALYEAKDKEFHIKNDVKGHYPVEGFNLIKKIEFLPNTLFIFPRTNISYHGVQTINTQGAERNLLLLNYYFKEIN